MGCIYSIEDRPTSCCCKLQPPLPRARLLNVAASPAGESWGSYSHGGRTPQGFDALAWCRRVAALGAGERLVTSMDRDGTGEGMTPS